MMDKKMYDTIEKAKRYLEENKNKDWRKLEKTETLIKDEESGLLFAIEICPEFTNLDEIDSISLIGIYNEYYDTNIKSGTEINWKNKDIKIVARDLESGLYEIIDVIFYDSNNNLVSLGNFQQTLLH